MKIPVEDDKTVEEPALIPLYDDYYAVRFPYHVVTGMTLDRAIPSFFMREVARQQLKIKFAEETQATAGTMRADCERIEKACPLEVAILQSRVPDLSRYVIFKLAAQ